MRLSAEYADCETLEGRLLLAAPVILKVSDAIEAGDSFTINGGAISAAGVDVVVAADLTGQSPSTPPAGAVHVQILQTDANSQYVVGRMPPGSATGVYNVWVRNADGWSSPTKMNAARALFISDYQAYCSATNPIKIEVVGRNFDQSEFGGATGTQVRLNNGSGGLYAQAITSLNPYNVTFAVGNVPLGTYYVEVSSDNGGNWSRPSSGQTLTIVATPSGNPDPLELGVTWAKDFSWTRVFSVTSYGANGSDTADDTTAVQNAVNAAEAAGGGVVYIPNGSYYLRSVHLAPGVVLEGQDEYATKIYYAGAGGPGSFIYSYSDSHSSSTQPVMQLQGIARLSILMTDPTTVSARPDVFINLSDRNSAMDQSLRTANRIFVTNVNLSYGYTTGNCDPAYAHRGMGILWTGKERYLFQNNNFAGWYGNNANTYLNQYFICRNNTYEYSTGYVHDTANYAFFENNTIKIHPEYNQESHGIFTRSDAYVSGNYIQGAGDASNVANDGEGIASEPPNGNYNYGSVTSARAASLVVAAKIPLATPTPYYGDLSVMITQGTGRGQLRKVTAINAATATIAVDTPFAIVPDSSSRFTLYAPLRNFTVYKNTLNNCASGILAYGNQVDALIADNTLLNTVGVFIWAARRSDGSTYASDTADYYVRIARNTLTGVAWRSQTSAIGIYTGRFDGKVFYDTMAYSMEIVDNSITGDLTKLPNGTWYFPAYNGIYISSYAYSNSSDGSGFGDATNTLIRGNRLSNLQTGIMLTKGDYGHVISSNAMDSTLVQLVRDAGSQNTLIVGDDFSPQGLNITSQGTLTTSKLTPISTSGSTNPSIIYDGITPQLSPANNGSWDDMQVQLQYDNVGSAPQYYGYTFTGNRTFGKIVFVEGRHYSDGGWFANGALKVQVRQSGIWVDVSTTAIRPYPNGNTLAAFGTGFEAYSFVLNSLVGDGIRIYGTAGGSRKYVSISELEVWALPAAPSSVAFAVNDGSVQRSMVNSLTVSFDQPVTLASDAISLMVRGGAPLFTTTITNSAGDGKTYLLTFSGTGILGGSLPDGAYVVTVKASSVTDAYGQPLAGGNRTWKFRRLFGDVNGDRSVSVADLAAFRRTLNRPASYVWHLDYTGDQIIDNSDYLQFRNRLVKPLL